MALWEEIKKAHDALRFAEIARQESRRTVLCHPHQAPYIRWHVDQAGLGDIVKVLESDVVPDGQMYMVDEQSLDAGMRESIAKMRPGFR